MARQRAGVREHHGKGQVERRPQSSPLMKFAMRPKNRPIGATTAARSSMASASGTAHARRARWRAPRRGSRRGRTCRPARPRRSPAGWRDRRRIVEQHVAEAAAEDDAERHPDDEIVDVGRARLPAASPDPGSAARRRASTSRRGGPRYRRARTSGSPAGRWRTRSDRWPETAAPGGSGPCRWV